MYRSLPNFPNSITDPVLLTSSATPIYNCIAWAYGRNDRWFWPTKKGYWPENILRDESVEAFIQLFASIGYELCDNGSLEDGIEKVAIYLKNGLPKHAARQLDNGKWTSKLGIQVDVSHTLAALEGGEYGNVSHFMRRQRT